MTRQQRLWFRANKSWIFPTSVAILLTILMIVVWKSSEERLERHNKYQCAVYGYEADCKTPLPPERRLK